MCAPLPTLGAGAFFCAFSTGRFGLDNGIGSGPYLALVGAMVRLARQDLAHPIHSDEARAFLLTRPFEGREVGVEVDLFAECLGYGGSFLNG